MDLGGISALSNIGQATSDRKSIADNFDGFLQLLTTQLQNQNPLDPLDTNEFTNQLVQFSTVEQNVKANENLEGLLRLGSASVATAAVGYIGKTVTAEGVISELSGGKASWAYTAPKDAPDATITVTDQAGDVVYSQKTALSKGTHTIDWDGRSTSGAEMPDGVYSIKIEAKDADDQIVDITTSVGGTVDSVDLSKADPVLISGDKKIPLSTVRYIGG